MTIDSLKVVFYPSLLRRTFDILPLSKTAFPCVLHYPYFRLLRRDCYANHKILPLIKYGRKLIVQRFQIG